MVMLIPHHNTRAFRRSSSTASILMLLTMPKRVPLFPFSDLGVNVIKPPHINSYGLMGVHDACKRHWLVNG